MRETRQWIDAAIQESRLPDLIRGWALDELRDRLPEIEALRGVSQPAAYHSEGDVFEHTLLVLRNAPRTERAQLAALLHDTGKPAMREVIGGRIRFLGHEAAGAETAEALLTRLGYGAETIDAVTVMVRLHMRPHLFEKLNTRSVRRFVIAAGPYFDDIMDLAEADAASSLGPDGKPAKADDRYTRLRERALTITLPEPQREAHRRVLTGTRIQDILGIGPGPEVGRALAWIAEQGVQDPARAEALLRESYR